MKSTANPSKGWNITFWIVQIVVAAMFGMAGVMKSTAPIAEMAQKMAWVTALPEPMVRFIGISELTGAIGLILPSLFRIQPRLSAWAAVGLVTIMVLAIPFHISRGEAMVTPINLVLGSLAAFVAWGRFKKSPISARN